LTCRLDAKLSRHAEPKRVIQLGIYSDLLKDAQGSAEGTPVPDLNPDASAGHGAA
jgi:hypothetical protein